MPIPLRSPRCSHRAALRLSPLLMITLLLAALVSPSVAYASRVFPETRDAIRILTDQLPAQMTDAQMQFAARHYAGSQKMPRTWTDRIRKLNPNFLMLHYQLAIGAGPAAFLDGNTWTNDFAAVTKHEDWFLHDDHGHRLRQPAWDWYVMDIRFNDGVPRSGFPAYWLATALKRMRDNAADGCFADSYTQDILMNQLQPSFLWFTDVNANWSYWLPELNEFGDYCADGFHQAPEHFMYLPNLGGLMTSWDHRTNLLVGDGGMNEGFCASGPGNYSTLDDWKLAMTRVLTLASHNKIVLAQSYIDAANRDHRWFILGAYLLTRGPRSYLNMFQKSSLEWYPEEGLDLGAYLSPPEPNVDAYWRPAWRVFRRDYQKGMVLVNPGTDAVTIPNLEGTYREVISHGGGPVPADGAAPGSLSTRPVTSLTIPAHSARVLLRGT